MTGHRNTSRLYLFGADLTAFGGLKSEFSKIQCTPATGKAPHPAFLLFSEFYFFRAKHEITPVTCSELRVASYGLRVSRYPDFVVQPRNS
jgi:hypothetical protein